MEEENSCMDLPRIIKGFEAILTKLNPILLNWYHKTFYLPGIRGDRQCKLYYKSKAGFSRLDYAQYSKAR